MQKKLRPVISLVLLGVAVGLAGYYLVKHPKLITQLGHTPPLVSLAVFGLYIVMFAVLMLIFSASIRICRATIDTKENAELNAHTLFINFFIPGQGGPVYRGAYLFKKYKVKIRYFVLATLIYYGMYAIVSACLMLIGTRPWWQTILTTMLVALISFGIIDFYARRKHVAKHSLNLKPKVLGYLLYATVLQAAVQALIYGIELHSVNSHIGLKQVITYTGAANLTLFVSLTPGAIGIRESFLIFTHNLHHISSANIIVANVIDRSVYLLYLLVLLVIVVVLQAHGKLKMKSLPALVKQALTWQKTTQETINRN